MKLYRVDTETLEIVERCEDDFRTEPPVSVWITNLLGSGHHCYEKTREEAEAIMAKVIDWKIEDLQQIKEELSK